MVFNCVRPGRAHWEAELSTSPNVPEAGETYTYETSPTPRWIPAAFAVLFLLVGFLLYAGHSARKSLESELAAAKAEATKLAAAIDQSEGRIAELRGQLDATSERLGMTQQDLQRARQLAQQIRREQQATDQQLQAQIGQVRQESASKIGEVATEVSGAKNEIESAKKDLEATRMKLERTIGDLGLQSGLIARNREELEDLKRRGERNIFEFDLRKSNRPQRLGPVQVTLKKVDVKGNRYTMDVYVDDKRIEKKDKTLYEPLQFRVGRGTIPYEIIVFEIERDRTVGYLSTPKEIASR